MVSFALLKINNIDWLEAILWGDMLFNIQNMFWFSQWLGHMDHMASFLLYNWQL